jgi:hypothetical protein
MPRFLAHMMQVATSSLAVATFQPILFPACPIPDLVDGPRIMVPPNCARFSSEQQCHLLHGKGAPVVFTIPLPFTMTILSFWSLLPVIPFDIVDCCYCEVHYVSIKPVPLR